MAQANGVLYSNNLSHAERFMLAMSLPLTPEAERLLSEAEYLAMEREASERHEYVAGKVYAMAGATRRHSQIAFNLGFELRRLQGDKPPCAIYLSDVKVRAIRAKAYYYPDVVVSCAEDDNADEYYVEKPCLIVEVTSKSTQWKDFTEKLLAYQKIPSMQAYLVVSQEQVEVTLFYRDAEEGWEVTRFDQFEQVIPLPCVGGELPVASVYAGIEFAQNSEKNSEMG